MLILTRRVDDAIRIGEEITVKVIEVKGGSARLGFDAPRGIAINREEIYRRLQREAAEEQGAGGAVEGSSG